MRGTCGFCLITMTVAACAAATPPQAGKRSALLLRADLAPTIRVSQPATTQPAAPAPAKKLSLPAPPEAPLQLNAAAAAAPITPPPLLTLTLPAPPPLVALELPAPPLAAADLPMGAETPAQLPESVLHQADSQIVAAAEFTSSTDDNAAINATEEEQPTEAVAPKRPLQFAFFLAQSDLPPQPQPTPDDLADPLTRLLGQQPDEYIRPIGDLQADITFKPGPLPEKYDRLAAEKFARAGEVVAAFGSDRPWPAFTYAYVAPALCHRPLYFEEPNVERYGYQLGCLQPVVSGAHFFATVPFVPYKMVLCRPHDCMYTLGQYRPGDYTPFQHNRFVWDTKAAVAQVGVVVGLVFLIP